MFQCLSPEVTKRSDPSRSRRVFMRLHPEAASVPRSDPESHQSLSQTSLHLRHPSILRLLLPVHPVLSGRCSPVPPHHPGSLLRVRVARRLEEPLQLPQVHTLEDVGRAGLAVPTLGGRRAGKRGLGRACESRGRGHILHLWGKRVMRGVKHF